MSKRPDRTEEIAGKAAGQAQGFVDEIGSILITHIADADTLDTLRPGETDLAVRHAVNRAVAAELSAYGIEVFVQRADRAAFRRWLDGRDDSIENRRRWIDRGNLLRGAEAMKVLGLPPPRPPQRLKFPAAPGPVADRLLAAYDDEESPDFEELAEALIAADRQDALDLALRKIAERNGEDAVEPLRGALLVVAEGGRFGPAGAAELVALPVALPARDLPDAATLGEGFLGAGILPETVELRLLPGWRSPDALAALTPGAIRRVLLDLVAGKEPRDLPPGDTDDLAKTGFGVLLGLRIDWDIPIWDEIAVSGLPELPDEDAPETPEQTRLIALFEAWRGATYDAHAGCVPLALVPASEASAEIGDFLAEAGAQTAFIDEIRDFIAVARNEAGGEPVFGRIAFIGEALELSLYADSGRYLDTLTLPPDRMTASGAEMAQLIGSLVRIAERT